jgi:hypothetical protein
MLCRRLTLQGAAGQHISFRLSFLVASRIVVPQLLECKLKGGRCWAPTRAVDMGRAALMSVAEVWLRPPHCGGGVDLPCACEPCVHALLLLRAVSFPIADSLGLQDQALSASPAGVHHNSPKPCKQRWWLNKLYAGSLRGPLHFRLLAWRAPHRTNAPTMVPRQAACRSSQPGIRWRHLCEECRRETNDSNRFVPSLVLLFAIGLVDVSFI